MKRMKKEIREYSICIIVVALVGIALYVIDAEKFENYCGFMTPLFVIAFTFSFLIRVNWLITDPKEAEKYARRVHKNMTDKAGRPYIEHVARVAGGVKGNKDAETAAWLHDVVEDTEVTLGWLKEKGVSDEVLAAVKLLTHDKTVPYMEYINGLKNNDIARAVKISDLNDNMDLSRFDEPSIEDRERAEKYKKALKILEEQEPG